jgi:hypothetical protein
MSWDFVYSMRVFNCILWARMYNSLCLLSGAKKLGCCYIQDKRPKQRGRVKSQQDPIDGLPMMAKRLGYTDGIGYGSALTLCFKQYCPDCQAYWSTRLSAHDTLHGLALRQTKLHLM